MESEAIKSLLQQHFVSANIEVTIEGSHVNLLIISELFDGLTSLKRQQSVYGVLSESIANGEIHAVNMKTLTPQEVARTQSHG
ncbi:cell division protein BolA [Candidatus Endobugula sertula]|uniref:Cell division protein BolA n=1 Tax=Candidatus Endobugula sertula TaxID=62101 RepID=A0A1D2QQL4_9GAMM|nr:cell division protein BolA [Candidatus Endobugula sertula]